MMKIRLTVSIAAIVSVAACLPESLSNCERDEDCQSSGICQDGNCGPRQDAIALTDAEKDAGLDAAVEALPVATHEETAAGLIAWLPLDGDDLERISGLRGGIAGPTPVLDRLGVPYRALGFRGADVVVAPPLMAADTLQTMTVCAWLRPSNDILDAHDRIVASKDIQGDGDDGSDTFSLGLHADNRIDFTIWTNQGTASASTVSQLSFVDWTLLCGTYDGENVRLFLNATEHASAPHTGQLNSTDAQMTVGRCGGRNCRDGRGFIGALDEVRLWNRALPAEQLRRVLTLEDPRTRINAGLEWTVADFQPMQFADGLEHCEQLVLAGHDDWRLPAIDELRTLIRGCPDNQPDGACQVSEACSARRCATRCGTCSSDACVDCANDGCLWAPDMWDPCPLPGAFYLSSTTIPDEDQAAGGVWTVGFHRGHVSDSTYEAMLFVRCVRSVAQL